MSHGDPALNPDRSSLFADNAGQEESNVRRWIIENDWLEAIVALPFNLIYHTGIANSVCVLPNRKPEHGKGMLRLIDATTSFQPFRKNLGRRTANLGKRALSVVARRFWALGRRSRSLDNSRRRVPLLGGHGGAALSACCRSSVPFSCFLVGEIPRSFM